MNKTFRPLRTPKECNKNSVINPDYYSVVVVQDIAERDRIPCKLRQNGMIAIVVEEDYREYQLKIDEEGLSICNNNSWKEKKGTFGSIGVWDFELPYSGLKVIDMTNNKK